MSRPSFNIGRHHIGADQPCYIIAELSANHRQSYEESERLVQAAYEAGADAVKIQTFTPETMTLDFREGDFMAKSAAWRGKSLFDLYQEAYMPWDWQPRLKEFADGIGIELFSSPFDSTAVDFLQEMNVAAYKIASFEFNDLALIRKCAATGKPIIMSTGMASLAEIEEALAAAREAGARDIALLRCTSAYPAPAAHMNLRTIPHMADTFDVVSGLSDHTLGTTVSVASVALGAKVVEKHFTLSREVETLDGSFSLEPHEFKFMVDAIRETESSLGQVHYGPSDADRYNVSSRRSLYASADIPANGVITAGNVRSVRPGYGLAPKYLAQLLGRKALVAIPRGTPISWKQFMP
ncbi:pseudaminic acid synthase [soil metagenome]